MNPPDQITEVFLQPGDFYFGCCNTRIRTLLGSCVSITMWHPRLRIGGMCHYMLPTRGNEKAAMLDGRYADEAMEMFVHETRAAGTHPSEYQVKLFGGGNMFPDAAQKKQCAGRDCISEENSACRHVSCRNSKIARHLVETKGFAVAAEHLGGDGHRHVIFDLRTGEVWGRHHKINNPINIVVAA